MQITRQYHSTALLLPDGPVLSSGGGICGTCDQVGYLAKNAAIFSPPYLFQADGTLAPRPAIDAAPTSTIYGVAMDIATANPSSIRKVALVRLGAVTHSDNMEQPYIPPVLFGRPTSISAIAPANANVAPPGPHAFHHRRERRTFHCPHGQCPGRLAAARQAHADGATYT